jgi:hypothetical protein
MLMSPENRPAKSLVRGSLPPAAALLAAFVLTLAVALPGAAAAAPLPEEGSHAHAQAEAPAAGGVDAKAAFERIKKLAGDWQGTMMTPDGQATSSRVAVTAGGSAVIETLFAGSEHEMVNVYHMDGADLVISHYCHAGNQPRLRYAAEKSSPDELIFDFAGGTSFDPAKDGHVHAGRVALKGEDRLESDWAFYTNGKEAGVNKLFLSRRR